MYNILESTMTGHKVKIGSYVSKDAALAALGCMNIAFGEWDIDNPECYDAFMFDGRIMLIEPEGFKASHVY